MFYHTHHIFIRYLFIMPQRTNEKDKIQYRVAYELITKSQFLTRWKSTVFIIFKRFFL
jgi:hypothetical protein